MNTTPAPAVVLNGVSKRFAARGAAPVDAVADATFTLRRGEIAALLGPNGAGKTTTLDILLGQYAPTAGTAELFGEAPGRSVKAGRVAALLQTGGLLPDYTVRETVSLISSLYPSTIGADAAMERAGVAEIAGRRIGKCSGGQQQRVKFALALLPDPELIVLDEPTTGMDVSARREFWTAMHEQASHGTTVLFATHYLDEAESFAERVILMSRGRVVADGATHELRERVGGRRVSFVWDPVDGDVRALPGVTDVQETGSRLSVRTEDSDGLARHLLARTRAHDLEIRSTSLEDAFLQLTGESLAPDSAPHTSVRPTSESEAI